MGDSYDTTVDVWKERQVTSALSNSDGLIHSQTLLMEIGTKKGHGIVKFRPVPSTFPGIYRFGQDIPNTFTFFGGRLSNLHDEMEAWRPQTIGQLFKPGYTDRFTYYTQRFALFVAGMSLVIALFGLFGIGLVAVQTAYAVKTFNIALESLELQKQQLSNSTS
jgi:hypothetical protein